jgi:ankyrin repeat protein
LSAPLFGGTIASAIVDRKESKMNDQLCLGQRFLLLFALTILGGLLIYSTESSLGSSSGPGLFGTSSGPGASENEPAGDEQKPKPVIKPDLAQCTLEVGRQTLKPIHTASPGYREERVGDRRVQVTKDKVIAVRATDYQQIWSAKAADGRSLQWLAHEGEIAYFLGYEVNDQGRFTGYSMPPSVRRLDLKTGRWLSDLSVAAPKERKVQTILAVLAKDDYVMVLSALVKGDAGADLEKPASDYQVTCFRHGKVTPHWSKSFTAVGARPGPGAYLMAPRTPDYAYSVLQHLAWLGDTLLVCPEAMQPLICLNPDTGTKIWQLDRPWEFERGFIGPSVWSHYMGRFRLREEFGEKPNETALARAQFDKQFSCALVGGPAVVPVVPEHEGEHRIFLAVSKGPADHFSGYISDCILFEFNEKGEPMSLVKLPQMVTGSQFHLVKDGVVWMGQDESFFEVVPSRHQRGIGMGLGGPDFLTRMPWFRQLTPRHANAWLVADRAGDPVAFGDIHAFRLPGGGYVEPENKSIYHFPLSAINLETGVERSFLLHVPFKGDLPRPKENYSETRSANGRLVIHNLGPYLLGVTGLRVDGKGLEITLGMENWSAVLSFDLGKSDLLGAGPAPPEGPDPVKAWLARLGDVNKPDESGTTPLQEAAGRDDSRFVKALLAAGANPRAPGKRGWTALLMAATDGTAETVQLLIDAGADVDGRDTMYGRTALIWAAQRRQSKKKVQALLKAGADLKATDPDGWNSLLSATSGGELPTVELLLQLGLDVSHRSKTGETALMVAASSADDNSGANLLSVLLKAGADVNARDNKGKTALMHAAESPGPLEVLRLLVESGADLGLKDNKGHTALDLARVSNSFGAREKAEFLEGIKRR